MKLQKITIFVPTYEPQLEHLRAALDAVLAQTEQRWTMLIHDDASRTDVRAIVEPYLRDPRVRFVRSNRHRGIGGNWNACLCFESAPYIQYLFQDDTWDLHFLERALAVLEHHPDIDFVSMNHTYLCDADVPTRDAYAKLVKLKEETLAPGRYDGRNFLSFWVQEGLHPNYVGEPSFVMLRASLVREIGEFREDLVQYLDVDYWIRCLLHANWIYIPEICGSFRVHGRSASVLHFEHGKGITERLQCFQRLIAALPRGELRTLAVNARKEALTVMARKFLHRVRRGQAISPRSSGIAGTFLLRHPLLAAQAALAALK